MEEGTVKRGEEGYMQAFRRKSRVGQGKRWVGEKLW